ncbi:MAG: competence protein ComK [Bacillus sp. (in: firmicutes)]
MVVDHFLIGPDTLLLKAEYRKNGYLHTIIVNGNQVIEVSKPPLDVINDTLLQYGSSLAGAKEAAKHHMGNKYTLPLALHGGIILFPVESPSRDTCIWLVLNNVTEIIRTGYRVCDLVFKNGLSYSLPTNGNRLRGKRITAMEYQEKLRSNLEEASFLFKQTPKPSRLREEKGRYYIEKKPDHEDEV